MLLTIPIRKKLLKQADAVSDFLKHGYSHHIDMDSNPFRDSRRALVGISALNDAASAEPVPSESVNNGEEKLGTLSTKCDMFFKLFQFVQNIKEAIGTTYNGLKVVMEDAAG